MTDKEYEKALKDREKAWTNEELKPHKLTEEEIYEWYRDRISAPSHPILLSKEECDAYNVEHPLPTKEEIEKILKEAGALRGLHNRRRNLERYGLRISACGAEQTRTDLKGVRVSGRKQSDEKGSRPGKRNCRYCGKYDLIPPVERPVVFLYPFLNCAGATKGGERDASNGNTRIQGY